MPTDCWEVGRDEYTDLVVIRLSKVPGVCIESEHKRLLLADLYHPRGEC